MQFKKTAIALALGASMGSVATADAAVVSATWSGLFTMLDPAGAPVPNTDNPYYSDPTWGYGQRTQISGTLVFDASTGAGRATVDWFSFYSGGRIEGDIELQAIGDGFGGPGSLIAGSGMMGYWSGSSFTFGTIFDASGFLGALDGAGTSTTISGIGALPASSGIKSGKYPIGPAPIATTSFDTDFHNDPSCVVSNSCIIGDDGMGGSPADGPFPGFSVNIDIVTMHLTAVPLPAAAWLLGSGLLGLAGVARGRKRPRGAGSPR